MFGCLGFTTPRSTHPRPACFPNATKILYTKGLLHLFFPSPSHYQEKQRSPKSCWEKPEKQKHPPFYSKRSKKFLDLILYHHSLPKNAPLPRTSVVSQISRSRTSERQAPEGLSPGQRPKTLNLGRGRSSNTEATVCFFFPGLLQFLSYHTYDLLVKFFVMSSDVMMGVWGGVGCQSRSLLIANTDDALCDGMK